MSGAPVSEPAVRFNAKTRRREGITGEMSFPERVARRRNNAGKQRFFMQTRILIQTFVRAGVALLLLFGMTLGAGAQVNSGSNGSDGAFNPTTNTVINMADHSTGIYHYTSVNIPSGVTVTFVPNANNTPVVWLVQSNCIINGTVDVSGQGAVSSASTGGACGPGGYRGGNGGTAASAGQGPGGGSAYVGKGGNASFGALGQGSSYPPGPVYGTQYLLPLIGGSGGGGAINYPAGGGGGGGAIMIAASQSIDVRGGGIQARGGAGAWVSGYTGYIGGAGSGGAVRLVATRLAGNGGINATGGNGWSGPDGGYGRVRFDTFDNSYGGTINAVFTQGYQSIIIQTNGQGAQLTITSVGGVPVSASPSGQLATPDALLSAQQNNPIPITVHCSNISLNTQITVSVKPANGAAVSATGLNSSGTLSSSTATVLINMPRGGGLIYATAAN